MGGPTHGLIRICGHVRFTSTVTLRLVEPADSPRLAEAYARNRSHLARWEPTRTEELFTAARHVDDITRVLESHRNGSAIPLVLTTGEEVVGRVTLSGITRGAFQSASLGYWIDARHAGHGIMSTAVAAVLAIARDDLRLHSLQAGTLIRNEASQRVLKRAGFEQIGLAPRHLRIAGAWQDRALFQRILRDRPGHDQPGHD